MPLRSQFTPSWHFTMQRLNSLVAFMKLLLFTFAGLFIGRVAFCFWLAGCSLRRCAVLRCSVVLGCFMCQTLLVRIITLLAPMSLLWRVIIFMLGWFYSSTDWWTHQWGKTQSNSILNRFHGSFFMALLPIFVFGLIWHQNQ